MKVVVVGKGAREHTLAVALGRTAEVVVTPGGPGIPGSDSTDPRKLEADVFVIGPEKELVEGWADDLRAQNKLVLGPGADGAKLEGSKIWMKELLREAGVPTASFGAFWPDHRQEAERFLRSMAPPWAIKTDYLAAGKGVLVTSELDQAIADVRAKLQKGAIVIEEGLIGRELSFFALCWGSGYIFLPSAQDYKRLLNGDKGPNTSGTGAYSPVPNAPGHEIFGPIVDATLKELRRRGIDYRGILYGGVMLTADGVKVLEYNVRFGDPETQVTLPRIEGDLAELFRCVAAGQAVEEVTTRDACVTVVLASEGYPTEPKTGDVINGIEWAEAIDGVTVYHAGTARDDRERLVTAGGRVLSVTAQAETIPKARALAYQAVRRIHFHGMQYRSDIAADVE